MPIKKKLKKRTKKRGSELILSYYPRYSKNPKSPQFIEYIKQQLIKFNPWAGEVSMAWNQLEKEDEILEFYKEFMESTWAQNNLPKHITSSIKMDTVIADLLDDKDLIDPDSYLGERSEWQYVAELVEEMNINTNDENYDWEEDAKRYPDVLNNAEEHLKSIREQAEHERINKFNTLNETDSEYEMDSEDEMDCEDEIDWTGDQKIAYDIIINHNNRRKNNKYVLIYFL